MAKDRPFFLFFVWSWSRGGQDQSAPVRIGHAEKKKLKFLWPRDGASAIGEWGGGAYRAGSGVEVERFGAVAVVGRQGRGGVQRDSPRSKSNSLSICVRRLFLRWFRFA